MINLTSFRDLESELSRLYEKIGDTSRSSLFNLVVWCPSLDKQEHLRILSDKITEKFPCRLFFMVQSPDVKSIEIKVSVNMKPNIACDFIEVIFSEKDAERIPSLILPHLIPDLPLYLLWGKDPTHKNALYDALTPFATRIIYDSNCVKSLSSFAKTFTQKPDAKLRDVNWTLLTGWRDLFNRTFESSEKLDALSNSKVIIKHKGECSIQAQFMMGWLEYRLNCGKEAFSFEEDKMPDVIAGDVTSIMIITPKNETFSFLRSGKQALIHISTEEFCQMPLIYPLKHVQRGFSFWRELLFEPVSTDYVITLQHLKDE